MNAMSYMHRMQRGDICCIALGPAQSHTWPDRHGGLTHIWWVWGTARHFLPSVVCLPTTNSQRPDVIQIHPSIHLHNCVIQIQRLINRSKNCKYFFLFHKSPWWDRLVIFAGHIFLVGITWTHVQLTLELSRPKCATLHTVCQQASH